MVLFSKANFLSKEHPKRYKEWLSKIGKEKTEEEMEKSELNIFKNDKESQNQFAFLSFVLFPFFNLFLCYTLVNIIRFLTDEKRN